jgi:hypothetical protein
MVAASALCIPVGECSIESMLVARGEGVSESRDGSETRCGVGQARRDGFMEHKSRCCIRVET